MHTRAVACPEEPAACDNTDGPRSSRSVERAGHRGSVRGPTHAAYGEAAGPRPGERHGAGQGRTHGRLRCANEQAQRPVGSTACGHADAPQCRAHGAAPTWQLSTGNTPSRGREGGREEGACAEGLRVPGEKPGGRLGTAPAAACAVGPGTGMAAGLPGRREGSWHPESPLGHKRRVTPKSRGP